MPNMFEILKTLDPEIADALASAYQVRNTRLRDDPSFAAREPRTPIEGGRRLPVKLRQGPPPLEEANRWDTLIEHHEKASVGIAEAVEIKGMWENIFQYRYSHQPNALDFVALAALRLSAAEWRDVFSRAAQRSDQYAWRDKDRYQEVIQGIASGKAAPVVDHVPATLIKQIAKEAAAKREERRHMKMKLARWRRLGEMPSAEACAWAMKNGRLPPDEDVE